MAEINDIEENNDDKFIKECPMLFKKYKILKRIGKGGFGTVYLGKQIKDNKLVAIKVEKIKVPRQTLESEAYLLTQLKGIGFPSLLSFGKTKNYRVLVEPLLGETLIHIFHKNNNEFSIEEVCMIALQIIDRIEFLHHYNYIHRDIKPDNFLIGKNDPNVIYMIDFGLCTKYISSETKRHCKFEKTKKICGTFRFASPNALNGGTQSRKDDLISLGYMFIYFMKKELPWQGINLNNKEKLEKILKMKREIKPEELCKDLPKQMVEYMKYVQNLGFEEKPDYKYLKGLFKSILKDIKVDLDNYVFSWINLSDINNLKKPVNLRERKSSSRERLYKKISESLERKQRNSSNETFDRHSHEVKHKVINYQNLKVQRNSNVENYDSTQNSKNISKSKNNTLFVNFDKTIDINTIESNNFDNQNDNILLNIKNENKEIKYIPNSENNIKIDFKFKKEHNNKKDEISEKLEKTNLIKDKLLQKKDNQFKEDHKQDNYNLFDKQKNELNINNTNNKVNDNNFGTKILINDKIKEMAHRYNNINNNNSIQNQQIKNEVKNYFPEDGNKNKQYAYKKLSNVKKIKKNNVIDIKNVNNKNYLTIENQSNNFYKNKNNIKYHDQPNPYNKNKNIIMNNYNTNKIKYNNIGPSNTKINGYNKNNRLQTENSKINNIFNEINNDLYDNMELKKNIFPMNNNLSYKQKNIDKNIKIIKKNGINKQTAIKKEYHTINNNSGIKKDFNRINNYGNNMNINYNINILRNQERFQTNSNINNIYNHNNNIPNNNFNYMINNNIQNNTPVNYNNKRVQRFIGVNLSGNISPFRYDFRKRKK